MDTNLGETTHKFVVVLNKKLDHGVVLNACAHMAAALVSKASDDEKKNMMFVNYLDADGGTHPVSALSLVVLSAKNSNQIRRARDMAREKQVSFVDFVETMTKDTYVEQMQRTKKLKEVELEYWGLCLFGCKADLDSITGKFSLWRSAPPATEPESITPEPL